MRFTARRLSIPALALVVTAGLGLAGAGSADADAPAQQAEAAAIPLPHDDPFYTYDGGTPLASVAPGTVLKTRAVTIGVPSSGAGALPATQLLYQLS